MSEEKTVKTESTAPAAARPTRPTRPARTEGGRPQRRGAGGRGKFQRRRKFCKFCADKTLTIDHKDPALLGQFVSERYKIIPSRVTSTCAKHQRQLTTAIKRARILALLSFTPLHHD
ncbi:MAG: 30S ribosomal protein S18 [Ghiorsea sp.]|nr:30S ribosomal protein S18 [Ghiorsea sp.]